MVKARQREVKGAPCRRAAYATELSASTSLSRDGLSYRRQAGEANSTPWGSLQQSLGDLPYARLSLLAVTAWRARRLFSEEACTLGMTTARAEVSWFKGCGERFMRAISFRKHVIESLESRQLLSVSVSFAGGTVSLVGDDTAQRVQIRDAGTSTSIAVDVNRNGSFGDKVDIRRTYSGVQKLSLDLRGGNDSVDARLSDVNTGVSKSYVVRGGAGSDTFNFISSVSLGLRNSSVAFDIDMAGGNDRVSLQLDDIANSTVSGKVGGGAGDDVVKVSSDFDIRNSSVKLAVNLGDGNDSYQESHDLEEFDIYGTASVWQTTVHGGNGNDTLVSKAFGNRASAVVEGTFSNTFYGDAGTNTVEPEVLG